MASQIPQLQDTFSRYTNSFWFEKITCELKKQEIFSHRLTKKEEYKDELFSVSQADMATSILFYD